MSERFIDRYPPVRHEVYPWGETDGLAVEGVREPHLAAQAYFRATRRRFARAHTVVVRVGARTVGVYERRADGRALSRPDLLRRIEESRRGLAWQLAAARGAAAEGRAH